MNNEILCPICREPMNVSPSSNTSKCKYCEAIIFTNKEDEYYSNINTISYARNEKNFSEGVYLSRQLINSKL
ncbi:MAG: hypothetical protein IJW82_04190, partial [Clostridia bacterium]|nr:hypothetical protein [Clostridia bacterium]